MTTIPPFAAGAYVTNRNASQLLALKGQLDALSTQLSTGLRAQTYGGLGVQRSAALSAQASLSALDGYAAGIAAGQTRTKLAVAGLTQVATLGKGARTTLDNGLQSVPVNSTASRSVALANLRSALDALNQNAAGDYVLGGRNTSAQPVVDANLVLDGTTNADGSTRDGLRKVVEERITANLGPDGNGRLSQSAPDAVPIRLTEESYDATRGTFGFTLSGEPTVTGSAAIAPGYEPGTATAPASVTLAVRAQPAVGDKVALTLKLPDGTTTTVTLTATAGAGSSSAFRIGSSVEETSRNLSVALTGALGAAAKGTLTANAAARAAQEFFAGSATTGAVPMRVRYEGEKPVAVLPATAQDTVIWYQGEDSGTDPRATQSVQIGAASSVQTGARANEMAIQNTLAGMAVAAYGLPVSGSADADTAYQAVADRARTLLSAADTSPSVQDIATTLSLASSRLSDAASANTAAQNTLKDTLDGIEQAPTQEVAVKLMDLQNRLQASYQLTSSLSKLSLVNYLG